jgi:hypothetical protein
VVTDRNLGRGDAGQDRDKVEEALCEACGADGQA